MAQKFATYHRKNFTQRFCTAKFSRRTHSNGGCHDGMRWLLGEYRLLPPTLVGKKAAGNAVRVASCQRPGVARFQCTGWPGSFCSRVSSINSMPLTAAHYLLLCARHLPRELSGAPRLHVLSAFAAFLLPVLFRTPQRAVVGWTQSLLGRRVAAALAV